MKIQKNGALSFDSQSERVAHFVLSRSLSSLFPALSDLVNIGNVGDQINYHAKMNRSKFNSLKSELKL